ncbi:hypothetical protein [Portibacter marinus]|uniref:hypothetical protein n=1 Tax=Portibacter marinus TaxID=2898660 RepID=UPI001F402CD1|nr:hypothetical protein [Portibacter marinus]
MKKHLWIAILVVFIITSCKHKGENVTLQNNIEDTTMSKASTDLPSKDPIEQIQMKYQKTRSWLESAVIDSTAKPYECEGDPISGKIIHYAKDGEIIAVKHETMMGDHSGSTHIYYLDQGHIYFVYQIDGGWSFGGPLTKDENGFDVPGTIDRIEENRFYIQDGKVIKQLHKAFELKSWEEKSAADFPNKEVSPTQTFSELKKAFEELLAFKKPC